MYKYVNPDSIQEDGKCLSVGEGTNTERYKAFGMVRKDVEQSEVDGNWYLTAKCPHYTDEEKEQQKAQKESEEKELALQKAIEELGKEIAKADLSGNEDWKAELREEYAKLMEEA